MKSADPVVRLPSAPAPSRFLGRQPIVDEWGNLFGHELLFRAGPANVFSGDPDQATREVVDHWMMLAPAQDKGFSFVNCTRTSLVDGVITLLPQRNTVLEILETIEPDPELIACCRALKKQGYRFALDDFVPDSSRAALIELADFIKIDFRASDERTRQAIHAMAAGSRARLLAEKIESEAEMRAARAEGCSLFQGYFFSRPVIVSSRPLPQNQLAYLRLLAELNRESTRMTQIEQLVMSDASLCYRVLRLANSALYGIPREVTSVRAALLMVGEEAVRRMVTVAIAANMADRRPPALVSMAIVRARFCELLAPRISAPPSQLSLLGMLSLLDALLETPMERILTTLPLDGEMKAALMGQSCAFSPVLDLVRSLEECDWKACEASRQALGIEESTVASIYLEALRWATQAMHP